MKNPDLNPRSVLQSLWSRRARLQALLFAGATAGAALLVVGYENPKLPVGLGE